VLAFICSYNSTNYSQPIGVGWSWDGPGREHEMCNPHFLYYTDIDKGTPYMECGNTTSSAEIEEILPRFRPLLPRNYGMEEAAKGLRPFPPIRYNITLAD